MLKHIFRTVETTVMTRMYIVTCFHLFPTIFLHPTPFSVYVIDYVQSGQEKFFALRSIAFFCLPTQMFALPRNLCMFLNMHLIQNLAD